MHLVRQCHWLCHGQLMLGPYVNRSRISINEDSSSEQLTHSGSSGSGHQMRIKNTKSLTNVPVACPIHKDCDRLCCQEEISSIA